MEAARGDSANAYLLKILKCYKALSKSKGTDM